MFLNKSHQKLKKIPFIEENITHVDLRRNEIQDISISNLNIIYLDLSDNKISEISGISNLKFCKILDLSYNLIKNISNLPPNLNELYLIANDISKICVLNLKFCKILDLAVNEIEDINFLKGCDELKELYLGSNKIRKINNKIELNNINLLDLQNNLLEEIDCSLLPPGIKTLLLSDNANLKRINNLEKLKELKLLTIERTKIKEMEVSEGIEVWR
jgi:protein phosphatase 1 regulatory subunit 7